MIVDDAGTVLASGRRELPTSAKPTEADRHEQNPETWVNACYQAIHEAWRVAARQRCGAPRPAAVAVAGTSGTLVATDANADPLGPAIMYNDDRADREAHELSERFRDHCDQQGYRFAGSFALAKALWLVRHDSERLRRSRRLIHQSDFIVNRLTGKPAATDYSNALKTGYDLVHDRWPAWLEEDGELARIRERLPVVVPPGTRIGEISRTAAEATGLLAGTPVVAGCTDGTAGFLASGAHAIGQVNTTLGTTLVFKRLEDRLWLDANGLIYSHKLPGGRWLPGAASSTGGEWLEREFAGEDLAALDQQAKSHLPCDSLMYPLARVGERFPFKDADARGFCEPPTSHASTRYAAGLQGSAMVERWCCEVLETLTGGPITEVFTTGGGSASDIWSQLRADVTGKVLHRPAVPEAAMGMAVLAASSIHGDLWQTIERQVQVEHSFYPDTRHASRYEELYQRFVETVQQHLDS